MTSPWRRNDPYRAIDPPEEYPAGEDEDDDFDPPDDEDYDGPMPEVD